MIFQALDARLDYGLRTTCIKDVEALCPEFTKLLTDPFAHATGGDRVYECLRTHMNTIQSSGCKATVHKHVVRTLPEHFLHVHCMTARDGTQSVGLGSWRRSRAPLSEVEGSSSISNEFMYQLDAQFGHLIE